MLELDQPRVSKRWIIMVQSLTIPHTFDEFIAWYPEQSGHRYELHNGEIIEMPKPTGKHSEVAGFLSGSLFTEIARLKHPFFLPKECVLKVDNNNGYEPDVIVLDRPALTQEPRWEKESIITKGASVRLVIEVVSTNWHDDYALKLNEYETMGIPEYWMVDYLALGGRRYIGFPKQPTLTICTLIDGEYQMSLCRGSDLIQSPAFPELTLTAEQIFAA
jgi:Uma2 family endonuclease